MYFFLCRIFARSRTLLECAHVSNVAYKLFQQQVQNHTFLRTGFDAVAPRDSDMNLLAALASHDLVQLEGLHIAGEMR